MKPANPNSSYNSAPQLQRDATSNNQRFALIASWTAPHTHSPTHRAQSSVFLVSLTNPAGKGKPTPPDRSAAQDPGNQSTHRRERAEREGTRVTSQRRRRLRQPKNTPLSIRPTRRGPQLVICFRKVSTNGSGGSSLSEEKEVRRRLLEPCPVTWWKIISGAAAEAGKSDSRPIPRSTQTMKNTLLPVGGKCLEMLKLASFFRKSSRRSSPFKWLNFSLYINQSAWDATLQPGRASAWRKGERSLIISRILHPVSQVI